MIRQERGHSVQRAIREAERDSKVLTPKLTEVLDVLVARAFGVTQERVGVESGALRATGRSGSSIRDDGETYVAYIGYGNDTAPVDYAIYHFAINEPWFEGIPATEAAMGDVIDAHLRSHLR